MLFQQTIAFAVLILALVTRPIDGAAIGLYDESDYLVVLDNHNFNDTLVKGNISYVIEFYNAYCGHCIRFASTWKEFGLEIKDWKNYVQIGAIDCSNADNSQICRDYEVMYYPTVRYFPPHPPYASLGTEFNRPSMVRDLKQELVKHLAESQKSERLTYLCDLQPYKEASIVSKNEMHQITFVIVDTPENYLARELIIDYCPAKKVRIVHALNTNEPLLRQMNPTKFPSLYRLENDKFIFLTSGDNKTNFVQFINQNLITVDITPMYHKDLTTRRNDLLAAPSIDKKLDVDAVYLSDLEATLSYSLEHEIITRSVISKDALSALKKYLELLTEFFPSGPKGKKFVSMLWEKIMYKTTVKGTDLGDTVNSYESKLNPYVTTRSWLACRGSQPIYRKYPCGLWTMFHTLTVQAANKNAVEFSGKDVLKGIAGYVKHFFGCTDCAEHFLQMVSTTQGNVSTYDDAVLWLWKAHNQVNQRLAGDVTEDPMFPKIQFPSQNHCKKCRLDNNGQQWNETEVLHYLKEKYLKINQQREDDGLFQKEPQHVWVNRQVVDDKNFNLIDTDNWNLDINTCMISYVLSCTVLIILFYLLVVKKQCKKNKYNIYYMLGKTSLK
ncbi:sulfhydryl oxidase 2 [Adelges cooleyi]|uniref:sulfhydryl oxidase 2 n=1 Tax=Adelges cooleyi TaxID=133065 RepID=UPI00217F79C3|nr:sulfhydryl oxidase 2 [Adelges cooleyi]XP_050427196.1 sulfhydryl oxidase 2 [Adelges cooleyi]XP_050427197.1 sulfhydryl oxidase 2 [Adelges cooleyi]XP_050427198.1 sulfhydryl oxidase 2 [Adelges cooleyi]